MKNQYTFLKSIDTSSSGTTDSRGQQSKDAGLKSKLHNLVVSRFQTTNSGSSRAPNSVDQQQAKRHMTSANTSQTRNARIFSLSSGKCDNGLTGTTRQLASKQQQLQLSTKQMQPSAMLKMMSQLPPAPPSVSSDTRALVHVDSDLGDCYEEIDQIYDYIRGLAPLPSRLSKIKSIDFEQIERDKRAAQRLIEHRQQQQQVRTRSPKVRQREPDVTASTGASNEHQVQQQRNRPPTDSPPSPPSSAKLISQHVQGPLPIRVTTSSGDSRPNVKRVESFNLSDGAKIKLQPVQHDSTRRQGDSASPMQAATPQRAQLFKLPRAHSTSTLTKKPPSPTIATTKPRQTNQDSRPLVSTDGPSSGVNKRATMRVSKFIESYVDDDDDDDDELSSDSTGSQDSPLSESQSASSANSAANRCSSPYTETREMSRNGAIFQECSNSDSSPSDYENESNSAPKKSAKQSKVLQRKPVLVGNHDGIHVMERQRVLVSRSPSKSPDVISNEDAHIYEQIPAHLNQQLRRQVTPAPREHPESRLRDHVQTPLYRQDNKPMISLSRQHMARSKRHPGRATNGHRLERVLEPVRQATQMSASNSLSRPSHASYSSGRAPDHRHRLSMSNLHLLASVHPFISLHMAPEDRTQPIIRSNSSNRLAGGGGGTKGPNASAGPRPPRLSPSQLIAAAVQVPRAVSKRRHFQPSAESGSKPQFVWQQTNRQLPAARQDDPSSMVAVVAQVSSSSQVRAAAAASKRNSPRRLTAIGIEVPPNNYHHQLLNNHQQTSILLSRPLHLSSPADQHQSASRLTARPNGRHFDSDVPLIDDDDEDCDENYDDEFEFPTSSRRNQQSSATPSGNGAESSVAGAKPNSSRANVKLPARSLNSISSDFRSSTSSSPESSSNSGSRSSSVDDGATGGVDNLSSSSDQEERQKSRSMGGGGDGSPASPRPNDKGVLVAARRPFIKCYYGRESEGQKSAAGTEQRENKQTTRRARPGERLLSLIGLNTLTRPQKQSTTVLEEQTRDKSLATKPIRHFQHPTKQIANVATQPEQHVTKPSSGVLAPASDSESVSASSYDAAMKNSQSSPSCDGGVVVDAPVVVERTESAGDRKYSEQHNSAPEKASPGTTLLIKVPKLSKQSHLLNRPLPRPPAGSSATTGRRATAPALVMGVVGGTSLARPTSGKGTGGGSRQLEPHAAKYQQTQISSTWSNRRLPSATKSTTTTSTPVVSTKLDHTSVGSGAPLRATKTMGPSSRTGSSSSIRRSFGHSVGGSVSPATSSAALLGTILASPTVTTCTSSGISSCRATHLAGGSSQVSSSASGQRRASRDRLHQEAAATRQKLEQDEDRQRRRSLMLMEASPKNKENHRIIERILSASAADDFALMDEDNSEDIGEDEGEDEVDEDEIDQNCRNNDRENGLAERVGDHQQWRNSRHRQQQNELGANSAGAARSTGGALAPSRLSRVENPKSADRSSASARLLQARRVTPTESVQVVDQDDIEAIKTMSNLKLFDERFSSNSNDKLQVASSNDSLLESINSCSRRKKLSQSSRLS